MATRKASERKQGVVVERDVLAGALAFARLASSPRSIISALQCVKLEVDAGSLNVASTDLYVSVRTCLEEAERFDRFAACPDARAVADAVKAMPAGKVRLRMEDGTDRVLVVEAVGSKRAFRLRSMPGDDYPPLPETVPGDGSLVLESSALLAALSSVEHAASDDVTHPFKCGIYFDPEGLLVTTDGHRLARAPLLSGTAKVPAMLLPKASVPLLRKVLGGAESVRVEVAGGKVFFTAGPTCVCAKLLADDAFPKWRQFGTPDRSAKCARVPAEALLESVRAAGQMAGKTGAVYFHLEPGVVRVTSRDGEGRGEVEDEVPAEYEGPPRRVYASARYVQEALEALGPGPVDFLVYGELDPFYLERGEVSQLVMPTKS